MKKMFLDKTSAAEKIWKTIRRLNGYISNTKAEIAKRKAIFSEANVAWLEADIARFEELKACYTQGFLTKNS
tara:strand:+ start:1028 stop:1243 length:216 start_codon:yes stop_codon:yes gene_type:complete